MTFYTLMREISDMLRQAGTESFNFETAVIVSEYTGKDRAYIAAHPDEEVCPTAAEKTEAAVQRRISGEPLQYILGYWEFYSLRFKVCPGVLIPRPETELLAEYVIGAASGISHPKILDLCCGSGCIAVTAAKHIADADIYAADLYDIPLKITAENAAASGADIRVVRADAFGAPPECLGCGFDIIVSNPPYIPHGDIPSLQREVQYEPHTALDGGPDGLDFYRAICKNYLSLLAPGGRMCFEAGMGQCGDISGIMEKSGLGDIGVINDYSGTGRVVFGKIPGRGV